MIDADAAIIFEGAAEIIPKSKLAAFAGVQGTEGGLAESQQSYGLTLSHLMGSVAVPNFVPHLPWHEVATGNNQQTKRSPN